MMMHQMVSAPCNIKLPSIRKFRVLNVTFREAANFYMAVPCIKERGGVKAAIKEKRFFNIFSDGEVPTAIKLEGGPG